MASKTALVFLAIFFMGIVARAEIMTELNDQDLDVSSNTKKKLDTFQASLKTRISNKSNGLLFLFLINFVQQKMSELKERNQEVQDKKAVWQ